MQRQPAPGSCHAIGSGLYSRPDPRCTPGALNPQVTQATIGRTICSSGWTSTVRPPESVTEPEKRTAWRLTATMVQSVVTSTTTSCRLSSAARPTILATCGPTGSLAKPEGAVEDELNGKVCGRQMTLAQAQHAIVSNWVTLARGGNPNPRAPSTASAICAASAQYDSYYGDYDVYVHSNQPDQTVTVTGSGGQSASWHTDSSGYADVYFHAGRSATGERITVRAGAARCSTTL